jgi:hypothetical protein
MHSLNLNCHDKNSYRRRAIRSRKFILSASVVHNSLINCTVMGRVVILDGGDLSNSFRTALNTLADAGIQMRPGTKLLTRYAVIVIDEAALDDAVAKLLKAGIKVQKDAS